MDSLSLHFASTLLSSNQQLERRSTGQPSLTRDSLCSLEISLNSLRLPPAAAPCRSSFRPAAEPSLYTSSQASSTRLPSFFSRVDGTTTKASSRPSKPPTNRRNSWSDARSCSKEERRRIQQDSESDTGAGSSGDESDGETRVKLDSFPPRRPSPHPLHRRVRSDPGPASHSPPKRDLRRALLKRRATLTQQRSPSRPPPSPIPSFTLPARSRRSIETSQALRLKTFNFPCTSASPFLSPSPAPSSVSSFSSSSANSVGSRFSDDSDDSDAASSGSETSESEGEDDDYDGKPNPFDLSLDLFPSPPSPNPSL
ncbi:hypothetical protein JCM11491_002113 [Sporobolomyces phaffii]